jgi:molybdopterin synthase catalytic subunit
MSVELRLKSFDPHEELVRHERELRQNGKIGAMASFIGTMRDFNDDRAVDAMTLEHYPGMTERHLGHIEREARERWAVTDILIIHRVGELSPGDPIVLAAVWAAHRAAAFDACRYLVEELKTRAPFWKKEGQGKSSRWVEHNTKT